MIRFPLVAVFVLLLSGSAASQASVEVPLTRVLAGVVQSDGRVDYARLASLHRADLDAALESFPVSQQALRIEATKMALGRSDASLEPEPSRSCCVWPCLSCKC